MRANSFSGSLWSRIVAIAVLWSATASAADLSTIERSIDREPAYSGKPQYALLVFGRTAEHRVWIVQDGRVLFVDRDADGDLTNDGPPVAAGDEFPFADGSCVFDVGSLHEGPLRHERVIVTVSPLAKAGSLRSEKSSINRRTHSPWGSICWFRAIVWAEHRSPGGLSR